MRDSLGIYISVPFCKAKCSYCNFASGVFGPERMGQYVERVCAEIAGVRQFVEGMGSGRSLKGTALTIADDSLRSGLATRENPAMEIPGRVDTIFLGGGTPSLLSAEQMRTLFGALRGEFEVARDAEVTLECAPGQLSEETLEAMLRVGMNRISFGVQSFIDAEARAVGRLHTQAMCLAEIERMRAAGVGAINVDLIAGLPGQTAASWRESVEVAIGSGVPHVSVYMLEVDEDSRLGRDMLKAGSREQGTESNGLAARYGAARVPTEDESAEWYAEACGWLDAAGIRQYEISNFAREGCASRHNIKYWRREPYVGFGLDAHSMVRVPGGAVRWANTRDMEKYLEAGDREQDAVERIGLEQSFEEAMFLGLRMNEGVELGALRTEFGEALVEGMAEGLREAEAAGLVVVDGGRAILTAEGRMASNEVFSRLLVESAA